MYPPNVGPVWFCLQVGAGFRLHISVEKKLWALAPEAFCYPPNVGPMTVLISEIWFTGKPPWLACSRISSGLGAT